MSPTGFDDRALSPEERLKAREAFFRLMSHEIRTPLNGVMGMLSLLERTTLSPDQASYIATARESGEHLLTLVNDLLDYARIDAGRIALEITEVRLEPLLQSVAELLSPRAHAAGIEIAWSLDPALGYIHADEGRLRQILFNLAGNALKFTQQGGVLIHVGLTGQGLVRFSVRDTGAGIAPEARERIFEEFGQADPGRDQRYGGAGLGLVVVKKLVEAMQGTLSLDSAVGQGSTFAVEFRAPFGIGGRTVCPRHPHAVTFVSDNPILAQSAETHLSACGVKLRTTGRLADTLDPFAVILADRSTIGAPCPAPSKRSLILLAQILLQREGCRVERAATGEDAVSMALARPFDLVFMDLGLPGLDGIGATKALRAKGLTTPIIALTANAYEEDRRACLHAGMNDFLSKPIEIVALKARLQAWTSAPNESTARAS